MDCKYPKDPFVGSKVAEKVIFKDFCFRRIAAGVSRSLNEKTFGENVIP